MAGRNWKALQLHEEIRTSSRTTSNSLWQIDKTSSVQSVCLHWKLVDSIWMEMFSPLSEIYKVMEWKTNEFLSNCLNIRFIQMYISRISHPYTSYVCTKFETDSSVRSKVIRGPKIPVWCENNSQLPPIQINLWSVRKNGNGMRHGTLSGGSGSSKITYFVSPNLPIHYVTFMGLSRRLRGVYKEHPPL